MTLPNRSQLNLIIDILLEFCLDCYILWNKKKLIIFKLFIAAKKILYILDINLLDYFFDKNALLIEYVERKLFALRKDNNMMKS